MFETNKKELVHIVLAHSYIVFFASFLIGFLIDLFWPTRLSVPYLQETGFFLLIIGTAIIFWAQEASHQLSVKRICTADGICADDFSKGPYKFIRSPTHLGLFLMIIGAGFLFNSISITCMTLVAFFLTRSFFIPKQEALLEEKYGEHYLTYKAKVKM